MPVPVKRTVVLLPGLPVTTRLAVFLVPLLVGENRTVTLQRPAPSKVCPVQLSLTILYCPASEPVMSATSSPVVGLPAAFSNVMVSDRKEVVLDVVTALLPKPHDAAVFPDAPAKSHPPETKGSSVEEAAAPANTRSAGIAVPVRSFVALVA